MPGFLRQATASQSRLIGPFLDDADFKTPETGLTIANTDIKLSANGAATNNKNSGGGTHRAGGMYGVTFDATDTATVGQLSAFVGMSGALPVWDHFTVLEEAVYDQLFAASAPGAADTTSQAAIKTKTDSLTFTQAGHVDANIQRINDVAIVGNGSGTPFNV